MPDLEQCEHGKTQVWMTPQLLAEAVRYLTESSDQQDTTANRLKGEAEADGRTDEDHRAISAAWQLRDELRNLLDNRGPDVWRAAFNKMIERYTLAQPPPTTRQNALAW